MTRYLTVWMDGKAVALDVVLKFSVICRSDAAAISDHVNHFQALFIAQVSQTTFFLAHVHSISSQGLLTIITIGRPEGCFLMILELAHPCQVDIEVLDCSSCQTMVLFLVLVHCSPFSPDRNRNHTLVTPFLTAMSAICAEDNPPPTMTMFVSSCL